MVRVLRRRRPQRARRGRQGAADRDRRQVRKPPQYQARLCARCRVRLQSQEHPPRATSPPPRRSRWRPSAQRKQLKTQLAAIKAQPERATETARTGDERQGRRQRDANGKLRCHGDAQRRRPPRTTHDDEIAATTTMAARRRSAAASRTPPRYTARLLIDCADRPGIVAAVSGFLFEQGANIVSSHQYSSDPTGGRFFMRTEFFLHELVGHRRADAQERVRGAFAAEVADALRDGLGDPLLGRAPADRDPRLAPRPLPGRPAVALAPRRARRARSSR